MNYVPLSEFMPDQVKSIDPRRYPTEEFELFSIPAYDKNIPEHILGREIGSSKKLIQEGDVLLSRIVPHIRRAWVVPKSGGKRQIGSGEWIIFRSPAIYSQYLRYFLISDVFHQQFMKTVSGVGGSLLRARPSQVANIKFPLIPLPEQKRIAAILDKADAIRCKRKESITLADTFLKSVFIDMFGDPVKNDKEWEVCSLEEIGVVTGGITLNSKRKSYPIEIPYLRVANVHRNMLDLNEIKTVNVRGKEIEKIVLAEGDILIVEGHGNKDEIGRCAVWDGSIKQCGHQNHLIKCRLNNRLAIPEFVSRYLNSEYGRRQLLKAGKTTSGLNTINIAQVKGCRVPLPSVKLQDKYARIVKSTKKAVNVISRGSEDVETLFNSLLHRAFQGGYDICM